jgi:2'-5' RNA ligase
MRAFLALEIPPAVKDYLEAAIGVMAPRMKGMRWVKQDGLHVTLRFLGEIEADTAARIREECSAIRTGYDPFDASVKGIDAFPGRRRARVIVVTLAEGVETIKAIYHDVEAGLSRLGIGAEEREYTPHITLGRARMPAPLLDRDIAPLEEKRFTLNRLVLFQSTLTKDGAIYSPVWDIKLGGRE